MDKVRELIPVRIKQHENEGEQEKREILPEPEQEKPRELPRRWYIY